MPRVQYACVVDNVNKVAAIPTPKRMARLESWYLMARKHVSEIPQLNHGEWILENSSACTDYVRFNLLHRTGKKATVVIQRNFAYIGG